MIRTDWFRIASPAAIGVRAWRTGSARLLGLAAAVAALAFAPPANADAVIDWFATLRQATAEVAPASDPAVEQALPLMALGMYDAIMAVEGGSGPGTSGVTRTAADAAVHAAAHEVLVHVLPGYRARFDERLAAYLATSPGDASRKEGLVAGRKAARRTIQERMSSGIQATTSWRPVTRPGTFIPPQLPAREWMSRFNPLVIDDLDRFASPGPPSLDSAEYVRDFAEVLDMGGRSSAGRSTGQTEIAQFWHSTDILQLLPPILGKPGRTLAANARLLAIFATAQFDASIVLVREKYRHAFWRPVTAIRNADQDGNGATSRDATWEPLLATPSHPDYPCGHCLMGALVASILAAENGNAPDGGIVVAAGGAAAGSVRNYARYDLMAQEISDSRVWGGVHFRKGATDGAELGRRIAEHILQSAFPARSRGP